MTSQELQSLLSNVGSVASLVGLGVSFYVFYSIGSLRKSFLLRVRLKELLRVLERHATTISASIPNLPTADLTIRTALAQSVSVLDNLRRKLGRPHAKMAKLLRNKIRRRRPTVDANYIWTIYSDLLAFIASLKELANDSKWIN
jgi:hypothetical protein